MSEELQKLKEIGTQKIHEQTHIALVYVHSILNESFEGMTKVQYVGFLSILEREYKVDLSSSKAKCLAYFTQHSSSKNNVNRFFLSTKKKKTFTSLNVAIAVIILITVIYYSITSSGPTSNELQTQQLDNTTIENVQKNILPVIEQESNESNESNQSALDSNLSSHVEEAAKSSVAEPQKMKFFKIIPEGVLWLGYIDIQENKKYTKTTKETLELSATKEWLIISGPGEISIEIEGVAKKYSAKQNMRFKYVGGVLEKIRLEEFKKLNRGRAW
jgi:hypothetical protein